MIFPDKDKNIAVMIQPYSSDDDLNGAMLYAMNKKEAPNYADYAKKYSHTLRKSSSTGVSVALPYSSTAFG